MALSEHWGAGQDGHVIAVRGVGVPAFLLIPFIPYCLKKQDFVILIPGSALDQAGVRMETGEGLGGEAWITARRDKNSPSRVYCCSSWRALCWQAPY